MGRFVEGCDRLQRALLPDCVDDYVTEDSPVRVVDMFVDELDLSALGFAGAAATGRPGDPTGIGRLLGLTQMGEVKTSAATEAAAADEVLTLDEEPELFSRQSGEESVVLPLGEGREVKATMQKGGEFDYEWSTGGPVVHYERHGEPKGGPGGEYSSYDIGTSAGMSGHFKAPMDGTQGWYWRNDTAKPVTVKVKATGTWAKFELVPMKPWPE